MGATRKRNHKVISGWVGRFREHFNAIYRPKSMKTKQKRYKIWAGFPQHTWHQCPIFFGSETTASSFESHCIRTLAPQWQEAPDSNTKNFKVHRPRTFPNLRKRPSAERNCELNVHKTFDKSKDSILTSKKASSHIQFSCTSFQAKDDLRKIKEAMDH